MSTREKSKIVLAIGAMFTMALLLATAGRAGEEKVTITPLTGWVFGGSTNGLLGE